MKLIAFDLDDTLYKERDFVDSGYKAVSRDLSELYGLNADEMYGTMKNAPVNPFDSLEEYIINRSIQNGIEISYSISDMLNTYRQHKPQISLPEDVAGTLSALKERGYRMAIITDGRITTQMNKLESLGISEFVDDRNISVSEAVGAEKYHKTPFERLMKINADIDEYAYVGDNPMKDFVWPNRLGWTTIQLLDNGRNVHSQDINLPDPDYKAQIQIKSFSELLEIFK